MARARWKQPHNREWDADTLRWHAFEEARGKVLREGVTFAAGQEPRPWQVRRSVKGRVNQVDIVCDGALVRTLGRRRLGRVLPGVCGW